MGGRRGERIRLGRRAVMGDFTGAARRNRLGTLDVKACRAHVVWIPSGCWGFFLAWHTRLGLLMCLAGLAVALFARGRWWCVDGACW